MLEHTLFLTQLQEMQFTPSHIHSCITHCFLSTELHRIAHLLGIALETENDRMKNNPLLRCMIALLYKQNKVTTLHS